MAVLDIIGRRSVTGVCTTIPVAMVESIISRSASGVSTKIASGLEQYG